MADQQQPIVSTARSNSIKPGLQNIEITRMRRAQTDTARRQRPSSTPSPSMNRGLSPRATPLDITRETTDERFNREQTNYSSLRPEAGDDARNDIKNNDSRTRNVQAEYEEKTKNAPRPQKLPTPPSPNAEVGGSENAIFRFKRNKELRLKSAAANTVNTAIVAALYWPSAIVSVFALVFLLMTTIDPLILSMIGFPAAVVWQLYSFFMFTLIGITIIKYLTAWQLFHTLGINSLSGKWAMAKHGSCMMTFIINIMPGACILIAWEELWFILVSVFPE